MAAFSNVAIENTADAPNSDRLVSAGVELRVSWTPSLLFPNVDSSTLRVDIILSQFYLTNSVVNRNRTFQVAYLSRSEANDGDALVTLPAIPSSNGQVIAITVQVILSQSASANLAGAVQRAKLRSRLLYYSPSELNFLGNCQSWVDRQQSGIGEVITSRVAPCPPLLPQANAINSGLREDRASLTAQFRGETTACFTGTDYILGLVFELVKAPLKYFKYQWLAFFYLLFHFFFSGLKLQVEEGLEFTINLVVCSMSTLNHL